ncbi:MAG: NAD-dependent epimerase/dehydratase family protein [Chloroflexota bacterium]
MKNETHVVIGATGALGSAIVRRLREENKLVRAVARDVDLAKEMLPSSAGIVFGDMASPDSVKAACEGAAVIYHCVNIRYCEWAKYMPALTENILDGARKAKAKLLFPGNLYVYGPFQKTPVDENHPHAANTKKGKVRILMEKMLMDAHHAGDVQAVIPRFPDFYGPDVTNPLMAPIFQSALEGKEAGWPGRLDVPHDLLFVKDAAKACVLLADTEDAFGQVWHVPGPGSLTGQQFMEMVFDAAERPPKTRALGRMLFRFFGLLIPDAGEMVEVLYLFEQPMVMDGRKFAGAFPHFEYTSHREAVRLTVEWYKNRQAVSSKK